MDTVNRDQRRCGTCNTSLYFQGDDLGRERESTLLLPPEHHKNFFMWMRGPAGFGWHPKNFVIRLQNW